MRLLPRSRALSAGLLRLSTLATATSDVRSGSEGKCTRSGNSTWHAAWAQSQHALAAAPLTDRTVPSITRPSPGGDAVRVLIPNDFSDPRLTIGQTHGCPQRRRTGHPPRPHRHPHLSEGAPCPAQPEVRTGSILVPDEDFTRTNLVVSLHLPGTGRCLVEEQDTVYRSGPSPAPTTPPTGAPGHPPGDSPWLPRSIPDERLLFRISALTANAHRIHLDSPYCRDVEGYPGLVVHGPLLALLMMELVRSRVAERSVRSLSYRLRQPRSWARKSGCS